MCISLVCREEISQKRMNSIRGIDNHERLDEELYHDFETDDARKVQDTIVYLQMFVSHLPIRLITPIPFLLLLCRNVLLERQRSLRSWKKLSVRQAPTLMCRHHSILFCCYITGFAAVLVSCLSIPLMFACCLVRELLGVMQKGDTAALHETKKKEMEAKRAAAASKGAKVFYKVTVKVLFQCVWRCGTDMPWNIGATFILNV